MNKDNSMNTIEFVTYDQAVMLKKHGFTEECLYHYNYNNISHVFPNNKDGNNYNITNVDDFMISYNRDPFFMEIAYDAPTLTHVQRWILHNKQYYIHVEPTEYHNYKFIWFISQHNNTASWDKRSYIDYNSPDEALSAAITEWLKFY